MFLVGFAVALGADNFSIGVLAAVPFGVQLLQIPAVLLVERWRAHRDISVWSTAIGRTLLFGAVNYENTPGGSMAAREKQIILKADDKDLRLELGREGKFVAKSATWEENRVLEGDKLEVAVIRGPWVLTHVPAGPRPPAPPIEHYFPSE